MTIFYNAFHSPIGAHASFTLGCTGQNGGLGLELGGPADENIYIGLETRRGGRYEALPFFAGSDSEASRYDHEGSGEDKKALIAPFKQASITRDYRLGVDTWTAGDLTFAVYSPVCSVPDPESATKKELKHITRPSVLVELTIDNTKCKRARRALFAYTGEHSSDAMRITEAKGGIKGVAKGQCTGIFSATADAIPFTHFGVEQALQEKHAVNYNFGLGSTGGFLAEVPAGTSQTFRFAICFFRGGIVTTGLETSYLYNRYFKRIEDVAKYSVKHFDRIKAEAVASDSLLEGAALSDAQRFQMVHAIRSYYGSTQLLDLDGKPLWVVNEGEYRMMNTFDLTVDHLFYEMKMNPWTVRNELDLFTDRYSYTDKVHFPGGANEHSGGISFTHDMGQHNRFSRPGYSTYELAGLDGCFSHMTHEQLTNWLLCASFYVKTTKDKKWLKKRLSVFRKCLKSMLNRDNPNPADRNGIMSLDSSRTVDGAEITTYDSLDQSLGQSRNNVYMAVKDWASYLALADIFAARKLKKEAAIATEQAGKAASTIASFLNKDGFIPAVMGEDCDSRIIPAIEGLVFPYLMGYIDALAEDGEYSDLIKALSVHFRSILKKGVCLYKDGGWKLSSTADNSWLSKIYLCQFVARQVLGVKTKATGVNADAAHVKWLLKPENLRFAWSDQMRSGVAMGSKYYPRGVTNILWLLES